MANKVKRYGMDFTLECENVKETEIFQDQTFINDIQGIINAAVFPITNVGCYEDNGNFVIEGQIIKDTKKETEAEYTLFKATMLKGLKNYFPKAKGIDRMKLYFTTTK